MIFLTFRVFFSGCLEHWSPAADSILLTFPSDDLLDDIPYIDEDDDQEEEIEQVKRAPMDSLSRAEPQLA